MIVVTKKVLLKGAVEKYTALGYKEDRILLGSSFKKIDSVIEKAKKDYDVIALDFKYTEEDYSKLRLAFGKVNFVYE